MVDDLALDAFSDLDLDDLMENETPVELATYSMKDNSYHDKLSDNLVGDLSNPVDSISEEIEYPFIVVDGLNKMFEIEYISRVLDEEATEKHLPVMYEIGDEMVMLGNIKLELGSFIRVLALKNYNLKVYHSEGESEDLEVEFLESMI